MKVAHWLFGAALLVTGGSGLNAEPVKLGVTIQVSTVSPLGRNVADYKAAVEAASRGGLTLEIFDKAQRFVDFQVPQAVGSGAIEMGMAQLGLYAKDVPAVEIFQQPFLFDSDTLTREAARPDSEIRKLIDAQILEKTGARVLWWQPYGETVVMSKNGAVSSPAAMQSRNIRAVDSVAAEFVNLCGGKPQVISGSKMLDALQTGKVDAVMTGVLGVQERELWKETQYITRLRQSVLLFTVIVNEKVWQGLPSETQALMVKEARKAEDNYWNSFAQDEASAYRFSLGKGMIVKEITSDELAEWRICSSDLVERFVEKLGDTAASLMTAYGRLRVGPCCDQDAPQSSLRP